MRELRIRRWADVVRLSFLLPASTLVFACGSSDRHAPPPPALAKSTSAVSSALAWQTDASSSSFTIAWDFTGPFSQAQYVQAYVDGATTPSMVCGTSGPGPWYGCVTGKATFSGFSACSTHSVELRPCVDGCWWDDYEMVWNCSTQCMPGTVVRAGTVGAGTSIAPPALASTPTDFPSANRWLFTGSSAPQVVPDPGAFSDDALAVIRGSIKTRDGEPMVCGRLSVVDHPEYGAATTWWDGSFALAVDGTGAVLVDVQGPAGSSYLPIQRRVVPRVHDYTWMDEARLTPISGAATLINSSNRFVLGPDVTAPGESGPRRLAAFFPAGTQATVDGLSPMDTFSVRAIEYTVGAGGPAAMPGLLPPSSGYTFAAAFALDGHERKGVSFSGPVALYVDNWAGVPVDKVVPNGSYDEKLGVWVPEAPEHNGRVIAITGVDSSGRAEVSPAGVTLLPGEATELARYWTGTGDAGTGHTLWRFEVTHFSSFDWNFAIRAIAGAIPPGLINFFSGDTTKPSCRAGSIIECENQTLGEVLPIAGTPFSLRYSSARQPGRWREFVASVEKPSSPLPKRVEATATIAGKLLAGEVSEVVIGAKTYYQFRFRWDGRDFSARVLNGRQRAHVKVGFVYDASYFSVTTFGDPAAMSTSGDISFAADSTRKEATLYRELDAWVDTWVDSIQGLGGWSLSPVHYYDAESQTLYRGDGGVVHAESKEASIFTVAGGASGSLTTAALARSVALPFDLKALAVGPDRSLYFSTESSASLSNPAPGIWKIKPDATGPLDGFDNALLEKILPNGARGLAVDGSGRLFFTPTSTDYYIYRFDSSSGLVSIAGTGAKGIGLDGVLAASSKVSAPSDLTVLPDGTLYFVDDADGGNYRVRRIAPGPEPLVRTVAGGGTATADGSKATELRLSTIGGIAARSNGDLFIAAQNQIWRVGPDGYAYKTFDSGAPVSFMRIAVSPDGSVFVSTMTPYCHVYQLEGDKALRLVAGTGTCATNVPDGGRAADAKLQDPTAIAIDSRGDLFVVNPGDGSVSTTHRVLRISHGVSSLLVGSERLVASADGSEVYVFDSKGIIQKTVDAFTGRAKLTFNHDPVDRTKLTSIVDAGGNTLTINRVSTSFIELRSHDNLISELGLTGEYLSRFEDPETRGSTFKYSPDGLLSEYRDPIANATSGPAYQFAYDSNGRLSHDYHPMAPGMPQTLARTTDPLGWRVDVTSGAGQQVSYDLRTEDGNLVRRTSLGPPSAPEVTKTTEDFAGRSVTTEYPAGATATWKLSSDPRFGHMASYASQVDFKPSATRPTASTTVARSVSPANATAPGTANSLTETVSWFEGSILRTATRTTEKIGTTGTRVRTVRPSLASTEIEYDPNDRLVRVGAAGLHDLRVGYDARGRITAIQQGACAALATPEPAADCSAAPPAVPAGCRRVSFGYDATNGYLACAFDPLGLLGSVFRDKLGRPRTVTTPYGPSASAAGSRAVSITPLVDGTTNVVVPVQPSGVSTNAVHVFTLDRSAGTVTYTAPSVGADATTLAASLGADQELVELMGSEPWARVSRTYQPSFMRPETASLGSSAAGPAAFFDYMSWNPGNLPAFIGRAPAGAGYQAWLFNTYDGVVPTGTMASLTPSSGTAIGADVTRTFDDRLRLDTQAVTVGGATTSVEYVYDADGSLRTATHADTTLTIDRLLPGGTPRGDGAPSKVTVANAAQTLTEDLRWSPFGELAGARDSSSVSEWGLEATRAGTRYLAFTYERDARGRITRLTETVAAAGSLPARTQTTSYTYRHDGALESVVVNADLNGSVVATRNYSYDINGNRDVPVGGGSGNTYDAQDRLVAEPFDTIIHDRDGRLVGNWYDTFRHTFDADGQLIGWRENPYLSTSYHTVSYRHDALGRRVLREESGVPGSTAYVYEDGGLLPIAEYRGGSLVSRFVYASRPNVPDLVLQGGKVYRIFADHLGSPRVVVDTSTGAIVQRTDYNEWGVVVGGEYIAPGFTPVPFGFAGGLYDRTTKYVHFGAREYDPARGRWLTKEPLGFGGGDTNFYAYAHNDPVNLIDPDGRIAIVAPVVVGGGVGFLLDVALQVASRGCVDWSQAGRAAAVGAAFALGGEILGAAGAFSKIPWVSRGVQNDAAWRALSWRQKALYELGQATLSEAEFRAVPKVFAEGVTGTVARGSYLWGEYGLNLLVPRVGAITTQTLSTGPTPLLRAVTPWAFGGVAGGAVGRSGAPGACGCGG